MSKPRVAICTNFFESNPGYSLTGIAADQLEMFKRHDIDATLFVCEGYNDKYDAWHSDVDISATVPRGHLKDYRHRAELTPEHVEFKNRIRDWLLKEVSNYDVAITHDFVYTGWNMPYAIAIKEAVPLMRTKWLHWIHSLPTSQFDWWRIREYQPNGAHKLVCFAPSVRLLYAEQFQGVMEDVVVIPHIKDLRTFWDFHPDTMEFIDDHPQIMQAEVVQVYPASCDRLTAKKVEDVIQIFAGFKRRNIPVCLVIANQWATGRQQKERIDKYNDIATNLGLQVGHDFIWTSEWKKQYELGLTKQVLRELMLCSNMFIFPTREESFGLVGPEAALSGTFPCYNASLSVLQDMFQGAALHMPFGSWNNQHHVDDHAQYLDEVAKIIISRITRNEMWRTKTIARTEYNMDAVYLKYYEPIMAELMRT
jgi:glycosyltransferase involved in cell wall biosynthesis